jgi:hypothetical protein
LGDFSTLSAREQAPGHTAEATLSPNPAKGSSVLSWLAVTEESISIQVHDLAGRLLFSQNHAVFAGQNMATLALENFPAGTYLVNVTGSEEQFTLPLLIVE